jgi:hypothetical protein
MFSNKKDKLKNIKPKKVQVTIKPELIYELEKKYGKPVIDTKGFTSVKNYYDEMLIKLANEYFGIDKD